MKIEPGPTEPNEILTWLEKNAEHAGKRTRFRLPVTIRFTDEHRLQHKAHIGVGEPNVPLRLDDSALGIPLSTHLRRLCRPDNSSCSLWLEGHWGPLVDLPGGGKASPTFSVLSVLDEVKPLEEARVFRIAV